MVSHKYERVFRDLLAFDLLWGICILITYCKGSLKRATLRIKERSEEGRTDGQRQLVKP